MITVYTAITGNKDNQRDDIKVFSQYDKFTEEVMNAKIYKILPHKFLDCDISIWIDGNIFLTIPPEELVEEWLKDADIAVVARQNNRHLKWELWALEQLHGSTKPKLVSEAQEQFDYYKKNGIDECKKMAKCGVIIRRHTNRVNEFNEAWWAEICRWSSRDQVSFPVVLDRFPDLKVNFIEETDKNLSYTIYKKHKKI